MRTLILAKTLEGFLIATDTEAQLTHPSTGEMLISYPTEERMVFNERHFVGIIFFGPPLVQNHFFRRILQQFSNTIDLLDSPLTFDDIKKCYVEFISKHFYEMQFY